MLLAESKQEATMVFQRIFGLYLALGKKDRFEWFQHQLEALFGLFGDRLPEDSKRGIKVSFCMQCR